ncbi:aldehyde dehydrogenase [Pseudobutyrivibrio xylanivorans]|uniref:Aldehyde dehydrogenase family protein n=1 Tax=Pseudobutyrivibrio xylanivorans TaxID=185007 RepID=A0A5P6VPM1_PSEXY|nr:aldehyde dehydrogenase [Pseudobutyrivibrio xylanivorans]QFJ54616.1 aldehyde dehydrogenase family protein [Pseudobutyrivibrio xylanivorans]
MEVGIFSSVNNAIYSVRMAYERYSNLSLEDREEIIDAIRKSLNQNIDLIATLAVEETGMGNLHDKKQKLQAAINKTPGLEDLITEVKTGDRGMILYELSAFGVVCTVEPVTSPAASVISHVIGLLAAGNSVFICPSPRAVKTSNFVTSLISNAITEVCGIDNLVVSLDESNISMIQEVMHHPDIDMIVCSAGEAATKGAMACGKKVIGEGGSNSVVLVDETADIDKAAFDIVSSASFDNNLIHAAEKTVIAVDKIVHELEAGFVKNNAVVIRDQEQMLRLSGLLLREDLKPRRKWIGRSADEILDGAEIPHQAGVKLIVVETIPQHPFVINEMRVPVLPLVYAADYETGLQMMLDIEQRYKYAAVLHSTSIQRLNEAARKLQTAIFVKNGPGIAGVGLLIPNSSFALTVANATGEGVLTARHFTRRRKCMLTNGFSIR